MRAAILLDSFAGLSDQAIARSHGVNRNTVILCIQKEKFGSQRADFIAVMGALMVRTAKDEFPGLSA